MANKASPAPDSEKQTAAAAVTLTGAKKGIPVRWFKKKPELEAYLKDSRKPCQLIVLNFTTNWCSPCQRAEKGINALAEKYKDVKFANIDIDHLLALPMRLKLTKSRIQDVAKQLNVEKMPTFLLFKQKESGKKGSQKGTCCPFKRKESGKGGSQKGKESEEEGSQKSKESSGKEAIQKGKESGKEGSQNGKESGKEGSQNGKESGEEGTQKGKKSGKEGSQKGKESGKERSDQKGKESGKEGSQKGNKGGKEGSQRGEESGKGGSQNGNGSGKDDSEQGKDKRKFASKEINNFNEVGRVVGWTMVKDLEVEDPMQKLDDEIKRHIVDN